MRLVKRKSIGTIHVTLNKREMEMREQISEMLWCHNMKWDYIKQEFIGEPPFGYECMKKEVMHDVREYRIFFDVIIRCMKSINFNFDVYVSGDRYNLYVSDGEMVYYVGSYFMKWFEQYFIDNTNILERWGQ